MNACNYLIERFHETPTLKAFLDSVLSVYNFERMNGKRFVSTVWHRLDRIEKGEGDRKNYIPLLITKLYLISRNIESKRERRAIYRVLYQTYYYYWGGKPHKLRD